MPSTRGPRSGPLLPPLTLAGFVFAITAVLVITLLTYRALQTRTANADRVTRTLDIIGQLNALLSTLKDAETGQRGYLLVGEEPYLEPYAQALLLLPGELAQLRRLTIDDATELDQVGMLDHMVEAKRQELAQTIELRRRGDTAGALAIVRTDRGMATMTRIRALISQLEGEERALLAVRQRQWADTVTHSAWVTLGGAALLIALLAAGAYLMSRDFRAREAEVWLRAGQAGLAARLQGDQRLETLGETVLGFLAEYIDALVGAVYLAEGDGSFRRFASRALAADAGDPRDVVRPGQGLLGQAIKDRRPLRIRDVPDDYLRLGSSLGKGKPYELLIAPAIADGTVHAVVELAFLRTLEHADLELLARASESIAIAVRSAKDRTRLEELLAETQRQAEELQTQQEELRVSNEELEEQGRALQESQTRLEGQQSELEQINDQLEEQARQLEEHKDALEGSQLVLTEKAAELERSSQYKSEFLANMSHELRTPLNSSLILAKLLSDNKTGNLNAEQVKSAQTIWSAGNDLLALINDVLDLSKIESGKVEVHAETVPVARAIDAVTKTLQPVAKDKGIALSCTVQTDAPPQIETDGQRLGQILTNLLSNALKFTERGSVSLLVSAAADGQVAFVVRDTGLGIPAQQHEIIFEAFRQADGSTHRKFGGTGLGLSISRDLARLLGGDITVRSTPGEGSTFTLTLPVVYAGPLASEPHARAQAHAPAESRATPPSRKLRAAPTEDDRTQLDANARLILVIEDDVRFAAILRDLAHELHFQCIVAHSAEDGLKAASSYRPAAIVLDMNLPDGSGLGVLDQLKHNALTRHVPVHVVSALDHVQEAMSLGAVGYALKPVKRDELVEAFRKLETKLSQALRRVLVVEDDARQRASLEQLLGSDGVEIVGAENAHQALSLLETNTFDCVVMDLNLPDLSGYELLEKMAEQEEVSFPPVIVYTGRSLTRDEEQHLRRFSRAIIIKDARSPERLLDEVTLFLHQVEAKLPPEQQRMLREARDREAVLEGRNVLVVEDDVRNIFALSRVLEPKGVKVQIARNGREALDALARSTTPLGTAVDLVLMDIMMPEMDGLTAMREIRKRPEWQKLPIIALTAKAMRDDHESCLAAGANDYIAKPLDVEKLLSLVRVWMPK